jgi:putative transposase
MYNPDRHHRRSIRLKGYDYTQAGAYFVTVCAQNRECLLGDVVDGNLVLNAAGEIVCRVWNALPTKYPGIEIDEFVVMPNHMHGIIRIHHADNIAGGETPPLRKPALGQMVAYFKYHCAKYINQHRNTVGIPVWQRNYYEHIIRDEKTLNNVRRYIQVNPLMWPYDTENTKRITSGIDHTLETHNGFTAEELNFFINYDIKYRMGRNTENEG